MSRTYRSWHRDFRTKRFNSYTPSRSKNYSMRKFFTRNQLIRLWNIEKGKYNY